MTTRHLRRGGVSLPRQEEPIMTHEEIVSAEIAASLAQVVAEVNGRKVTRGELRDAFDRVADKANWKNPVDAVIDISGDAEMAMIREAVIFFTGSVPKFAPRKGAKLPGCRYRVTARGYYLAVGA